MRNVLPKVYPNRFLEAHSDIAFEDQEIIEGISGPLPRVPDGKRYAKWHTAIVNLMGAMMHNGYPWDDLPMIITDFTDCGPLITPFTQKGAETAWEYIDAELQNRFFDSGHSLGGFLAGGEEEVATISLKRMARDEVATLPDWGC